MVNREPYLDFLSDRRGVYGIGITEGKHRPLPIIIRPDCIFREEQLEPRTFGALQRITPGRCFGKTLEGKLLRGLHEKYLVRHGLNLPKEDDWNEGMRLGSDRERRIYYGTQRAALRILNRHIASVLDETAPPAALTLARRFNIENRLGIYRAIVTSRRTFQLAESFPALAVALFGSTGSKNLYSREEVMSLVEEGAPLKKIAKELGIPMALRKLKPGVAYLAIQLANWFDAEPRLIHDYLPSTQPGMRIWLYAIGNASEGGKEYIKWVARNALKLGKGCRHVADRVSAIADWARAGEDYRKGNVDEFDVGARFITRPLNRNMAVDTVIELSNAWHRDVAQFSRDIETGIVEFPQPWLEGAHIGQFRIQPITDVVELREEGLHMRHCVATYASRVVKGVSYIYSVRRDEERVATLELVRNDEADFSVGQISGIRNSRVSGDVAGAIRRWASAGTAA